MVEAKPSKDVFWKALIYTIIIFLIGVYLGFLLEERRIGKIESNFEDLLLDWNDAEVLSLYYQSVLDEDFCEQAIQQNVEFGNKIYEAGLILEKYEDANRFEINLRQEKINYALLKMKFYINSKIIKEKCNADYDFIFYFYLDDPDLDIREKQNIMSIVLLDVKYELGDKVILIPLPADLDVSSVNILVDTYNIDEFPAVVIRENTVVKGLRTKEEILQFFQ